MRNACAPDSYHRVMSVIDEVLKANEAYAQNHELAHLSPRPARRLAILTCMDTRLSKKTLGLRTGEAHILRNAGGIVTEDVVRSLVISSHLLGTQEFMVINHTDCGLMGQSEEDLRSLVLRRTGSDPATPEHFFAFADINENVRQQIKKLRSHSWIPPESTVRGFVYDVLSGRLREVYL
jgi:carbonic anhydrase